MNQHQPANRPQRIRNLSQARSIIVRDMPRDTLRPGLRMLPAGRSLILYLSLVDGGVEIIRVPHSARPWEDLL